MKKLFFIMLLIIIAGCAPVKYSETRDLLGTYVTITIYGKSQTSARSAADGAYQEIKKIQDKFSEYEKSSIVFRLNEGEIIRDNETALLIRSSLEYSRLSNGSFDITVKPILDLYNKSFNVEKRPPTDSEIKDALREVGYSKIKVDGDKINLHGAQITLGGIAKGYAIDRAIEVLKKEGVKDALVNAGGDIKVIGKKDGKFDWSIALTNPDKKTEYLTIVKLDNGAVATSGNYERYFDANKTFHHIINPATGYSADDVISTTITAKTAIRADALATSVFVMGPEKGMELIESLDGIEGLIVTKDRKILKSSGWK